MKRLISAEDVLEHHGAQLTAEGYKVYLYPEREVLPPFLKHCQPSAIALRNDRNLVIAVKRKTDAQAKEEIAQLEKALEGQKNWELRAHVLNLAHRDTIYVVPDSATIGERAELLSLFIKQKKYRHAIAFVGSSIYRMTRRVFVKPGE